MSKWTEFHDRHGNRNYTPAFNEFLEALIADPKADLFVRVMAWILRTSWGNHSDACVDWSSGAIKSQSDCAAELKLLNKNGKQKGKPQRQKVNPIFQQFVKAGYIEITGQKQEIRPIDDPLGIFAESSLIVRPIRTTSEDNAKMTVSQYIQEVWGTEHPSEFKEYQETERRYKELRTAIVSEFKAHQEQQAEAEADPLSDEPEAEERPNGGRQGVRMGGDTASERDVTNRAPSYMRTENLKPSSSASSSSSNTEPQTTDRTTTNPTSPVEEKNKGRAPVVRSALVEYVSVVDDHLLRDLLVRCRDAAPDVTDSEIAYFVRAKGPLYRGKGKPPSYLVTSVVNCMGSALQDHREKERQERAREEAQSRRSERSTEPHIPPAPIDSINEPLAPEPSPERIAELETEIAFLRANPGGNEIAARVVRRQLRKFEDELARMTMRKPAAIRATRQHQPRPVGGHR